MNPSASSAEIPALASTAGSIQRAGSIGSDEQATSRVIWSGPANPSQDPSDRRPHTCYLGDPRIANDGPVGLARFTTLRSWLSQWSFDESRANGVLNAANVTCPTLVVSNTADLACTPSHARRLFDALGCADKRYVEIKDADHYYIERPDLLPQAVAAVEGWLGERGF